RLEMVAAVAQRVHHAHDAPALQLAKARAHVRARYRKRPGDVFGVDRLGRNEKQRMDLRHGAVDAPAGAHFTPVEDELLRDGSEGWHSVSLSSVITEITVTKDTCQVVFRASC